MLNDLRHAWRMLGQNKGWTAVVLLSLAIGIGASTALFSAVNGLLLKTIPVVRPETLARLKWYGRNDMVTNSSDYGYSEKRAGEDVRATFSYPAFQELRSANETLTEMFACAPVGRVNVVAGGEAETASAFVSSGNYFSLLGVPAALGRTITPEDDQPTAAPVAMISHGYWSRRFGRDPQVVGKVVNVNDTPVTIVGVTPPDFTGIQRPDGSAPDIHLPLSLDPQISGQTRLSQPTYWWLQIMGRLRPGVTPEQVRGNLEGVFQQTAREGWSSYLGGLSPEQRSRRRNQERTAVPRLDVSSGNHGVYDPRLRETLPVAILGVVVALVLMIVCANVANLLLSRATARRREISIRLSMGATRGRLIRQLLTESLLLSVMGGMLGLLLAYWSRELLPFGRTSAFDWRVFAFVGALSLLTAVAFGLAPAVRATRVDLSSSVKEESRTVIGSRTVLSKSLLVLQVAISLVLLIGAGLLLRTLQNLRSVEVGFNPQNLLLFSVDPGRNRYDQERILILYEQMREHLREIPGVRSVSLSQTALLAGSTYISSLYIQGHEAGEDTRHQVHVLTVSPGFFETMAMPVLAGRAFSARDDKNAVAVALINETAARNYFPQGSPLGRRLGFSPEQDGEIEIVGIVQDTKYSNLRDAVPPTVYLSYLQRIHGRAAHGYAMTFQLRTAGDPRSVIPAMREAVRQIDPNLPLMWISTQAEQIENLLAQERFFASSYSFFGGLALLLACIGLFGLMSYSVVRRTNEIGIRMALGAQGRDVMQMVLREALVLAFLGIAIGLAAAVAASRLLSSLLFGVAPTDALTIVLTVLLMVVVSALAGYLPARRASRVDPMIALRYQ